MVAFSKRNGFNKCSMQLEDASRELKGRIFASFYKEEYVYDEGILVCSDTTGIEEMMIEMGIPYEYPDNSVHKSINAKKLEKYLLETSSWYVIFDFIEKYLAYYNKKNRSNQMLNEFNRILEDEASAYRIVDGQVVPITNESELSTISEAMQTKYSAVNTHISKALNLFADRRKPDYENSIKESISAVESMCCIITGDDSPNSTLGKTIKRLKEKGVHIHSAFESAISSLYGYTSNESGIRHGSIDFTNAQSEDAKYMLVSCSAFVNYLIEKWRKVNLKKD